MNAFKVLGVSATIFAAAVPVYAASAHGESGSWWVKAGDTGSSSVWFGTFGWAKTANINWTVPTFNADGAALPTAPVPFSENKFDIDSGGFPVARTWTGYNPISGTGTAGSVASSTGTGSSNVGIVFYGANWTVTATGTLGTPAPGVTTSYDVKAVADDPWNIMPSDLSTIKGSTYSTYLPVSILDGQTGVKPGDSASGGFGYDVTYTTAGGSSKLFSLQTDASKTGPKTTVATSPDFGDKVSFYLEPNATTVPTGSTVPGTLLTPAQLQTLMAGKMLPDGSLSSPTYLGIVLDGIPIPTTPLSDGSVAQFDVSTTASASAMAPEPSSVTTVGIVALFAGGLILKARKRTSHDMPTA